MRAGITKLLVVVLAALSAAAVYRHVSRVSEKPSSGIPREVIALYSTWKNAHGKLYSTPAENDHRLRVFYSQKQFVDKANVDYASAMLKRDGTVITENPFTLNGFADLAAEEFQVMYTGATQEEERIELTHSKRRKHNPKYMVDQSGFQLRIRNQRACGSCWAFSAVATYEKFYYNVRGVQMDLSQQHLVDCDDNSNGCQGGLSAYGLFFISHSSVALEANYPYMASDTQCNSEVQTVDPINFEIAKVGFNLDYATKKINEEGQYISVSVYASGKFRFISTKDAFIDASLLGECSKPKDHAINAVGAKDGMLQLLNSWGTSWGDNGTKFVKPCSSTKLWSEVSYITTPEIVA